MNASTPTSYRAKSIRWRARELFGKVQPDEIALSDAQRESYRDFLWYDLCAEYDATNLYAEIMRRSALYSDAFLSFIETWYVDELNHTEGFRQINRLLFGLDPNALDRKLAARTPNFEKLEEFLSDEFKLSVLLAYDECATQLTYQKDTFYKSFGHHAFSEWIRRVRIDEGLHFGNLVRLIRVRFPERLGEVRAVLLRIMQVEQLEMPYQATFLFDHDTPHFLLSAEELATVCVNRCLQKITNDKAQTI